MSVKFELSCTVIGETAVKSETTVTAETVCHL